MKTVFIILGLVYLSLFANTQTVGYSVYHWVYKIDSVDSLGREIATSKIDSVFLHCKYSVDTNAQRIEVNFTPYISIKKYLENPEDSIKIIPVLNDRIKNEFYLVELFASIVYPYGTNITNKYVIDWVVDDLLVNNSRLKSGYITKEQIKKYY